MSYEDKTLTCQDCGQPFTFTAEDQQFHAEKGYLNDPKRCKSCREERRHSRNSRNSSSGYEYSRREMYPATCAQCGKETEVPFQPRDDRPVYCRDCYSQRNTGTRRY